VTQTESIGIYIAALTFMLYIIDNRMTMVRVRAKGTVAGIRTVAWSGPKRSHEENSEQYQPRSNPEPTDCGSTSYIDSLNSDREVSEKRRII
jgi:hypothetical protein